ncbi:MAG: peptidoglycan DD-metalloendopeptidase family protein [Clostridia bacterium]
MKKVFKNVILLVVILITFNLNNVFAKSVTDYQKDIEAYQKNIDNVKKQLENNQNKLGGIEREVNSLRIELLDLNSQIEVQNTSLEKLVAESDSVKSSMEANQKLISNATDKQEGAEDLLQIRLRAIYENGATDPWELLFSSSSIMQYFEKKKVIAAITEHDKNLIDSVSNQKEYLNGIQKEIELQKIKLDQITFDKEKTAEALKTSKNVMESRTVQLNSNKQMINSLNATLQKEEQALSEKLAAEIIKLQQESGNIVSEKGFVWPFPTWRSVFCGFNGYPGHTGIDISPSKSLQNKSIVAAKSGKVIRAVSGKGNTYPWSYDYGNYIIIDHGNGESTLYGHLSSLNVSSGQFVVQGQKIGVCGNTGYSTGLHLHFEVRIGGRPKNPLNYVKY